MFSGIILYCHGRRPRVRVPSSPPYIPKDSGVFGGNQGGCKRTQICAPFVSFLLVTFVWYLMLLTPRLEFRFWGKSSFRLPTKLVTLRPPGPRASMA